MLDAIFTNPVRRALEAASASNALEGHLHTLPELQLRERCINGDITLDELRALWAELPQHNPGDEELALREQYEEGAITIRQFESKVLALAA
jgi:hypothetical protein